MPYFMTTSYKNRPSIELDDFWYDSWGDIVKEFIEPINKGLKINPSFFPQSGFLREAMSEVPTLFSTQFWFCSKAIKEAIDQLEPGKHRFHPFSLRDASGGHEIEQLYIINILDPVDAVDVEKSENLDIYKGFDGQEVVKVSPLYLSKDKRETALHPDRIKGRHLWLGPGAYGPGKAFVSDALHDMIKQHDSRPSPLIFYRTK